MLVWQKRDCFTLGSVYADKNVIVQVFEHSGNKHFAALSFHFNRAVGTIFNPTRKTKRTRIPLHRVAESYALNMPRKPKMLPYFHVQKYTTSPQ